MEMKITVPLLVNDQHEDRQWCDDTSGQYASLCPAIACRTTQINAHQQKWGEQWMSALVPLA